MKRLVAFGAGILMSAAVHAGPMSCTSAATYTLDSATDAACFSGNDTPQIDAAFSMFGMTGWILADKNDDATSGDQSITFTTAPGNGTKSGDWAISLLDLLGTDVVVTLKAGNGFGAFKIDSVSGTWASTKNLSHSSIYYKDGGGTTGGPGGPGGPGGDDVTVSEPGSLALLGLVMLGLGMLRRRRTA